MLSEAYAVYANQQFRQAAGRKCIGAPVSYSMYKYHEPSPTTYVNVFFFTLNLYPIRNEDTLNQENHFIHVAYSLIIVSVIF